VTVVRKFRFLSEKARRIHACYIATGKLKPTSQPNIVENGKRNGYAPDLFNPLFDYTVFRNIQQTVLAITDDLQQGLIA